MSYVGTLEPLTASPELFENAVKHARSSASADYLEHHGKDGTLPSDRNAKAMPCNIEGNKNSAAGPGTAEAILLQLMIDSWVDTRGHRKYLLNPEWRYVACHKVDQTSTAYITWWMQEFAR